MSTPTRPPTKKAPRQSDVERERRQFHALLASNPNYFGTLPELDLPVQLAKQSDTSYERLTCAALSPERDRLEATVEIRRGSGYRGGLCGQGSFEHVRFFLSYDGGASWVDEGLASINVHDLTGGRTCKGDTWPPLTYVCGVDVDPRRSWCRRPVLPLLRVILSWEIVPAANQPDQAPIWGDVHECHVQVQPRRFILGDIVGKLPDEVVLELPPYVLQELPSPIPDPGPLAPLPLVEVAALYTKDRGDEPVPDHRFALPHLLSATADEGPVGLQAFVAAAQQAKTVSIDLASFWKNLESTSGDTSYEELECVGLDNNTEQLVASFRVKRSNGFSGGPCTAGSNEFVAYWADFGDECTFAYLGTVKVNTHDYAQLPDGGLCYAAPLPVDLGQYRRRCSSPVIGRVRAVLSWGTPPSTTDPDAVPYWGNRMDTHVQLTPGRPYDGRARFTITGGVGAASVSPATGMTLPGAALAVNGSPLPPDCAFTGVAAWHGPLDPALAGQLYRVRVRNLRTGGTVSDLTQAFSVVDSLGVGSSTTPGAGGWTPWPTWTANTTGKLGHFTPGGDDLWEVQLHVSGLGVVDVRRLQLDSTLNASVVAGDSVNAADLQLDTMAACRVARGPLSGRFVARDQNFHAWSIGVIGGPGSPIVAPLVAPVPAPGQTPMSGTAFTLDLSALDPCGYVVRLGVTDRVVVDSASFGRTTYVDRGVCLE